MTLTTTLATLSRRVRIRSWKDVVAIIVTGIVYGVVYYGLPKLFPAMSERTAKLIGFVAALIVCIIMLFALGA
ncbi:MAG: hypothetical protein IKI21_10830 [Oscillospiraceae bacterium]|nr:hypothetical protein [Oscillospiraceae bacterium]